MKKSKSLPWNYLKNIHDNIATTAVGVFNQELSLHPQVFVVGENTRDIVALPEEVSLFLCQSNDGKDYLANFIFGILSNGSKSREKFYADTGFDPVAVVQVNEVWVALNPSKQDMDDFSKGKSSVSELKSRTEAVVVTVHHNGISIPVMHEILDTPMRHCVKSEFPDENEVLEVSGRLAMQSQVENSSKTRH